MSLLWWATTLVVPPSVNVWTGAEGQGIGRWKAQRNVVRVGIWGRESEYGWSRNIGGVEAWVVSLRFLETLGREGGAQYY